MKTFIRYIKKFLIVMVVAVFIWLIVFGVRMEDKLSRGPIGVPGYGLKSSMKSCLGFITTRPVSDASIVSCHGLVIGPQKCLGIPYTAPTFYNAEYVQLDCNYPCNDIDIKNACQNNSDGLSGNCSLIKNKCNW